MSEEDRAQKAARAKALLKKRQQQKKAGAPTNNAATVSPASTPSRVMSPVPSQQQEETQQSNEFGELTQKLSSTLSPEFYSSQKVEHEYVDAPSPTPPPSFVPPPSATNNPIPPRQLQEDLATLVRNQQQTISLLVSEKASLAESLQRLDDVDSKLQAAERQLEEDLHKSNTLKSQLALIEGQSKTSSHRAQELASENVLMRDKINEQERELHLALANVEDLRTQVEERERQNRELEEQMQNDDRIEELENSLQNTQARADELEFQLSKLRQTHNKLKNEHDVLEADQRQRATSEKEWECKYASLDQDHVSTQGKLSSISLERDALLSTKTTLESQLESSQKTLAEVQQRLSQAISELATNSRQLESVHAELRSSMRRAEDAERTQKDLQNEGSTLMRSLEEMRTKTVELTDAKLELTDRVDAFSRELRQRDTAIAQLEAQLEQMQHTASESTQRLEELEAIWEKDKLAAEENMAELQREYSALQVQHDDAVASVREIDQDRTHARQTAARQQEEIDRLRTAQQARAEEIAALQQQLEEANRVREEQGRHLQEAQSDVESLRAELNFKEDEITRLRTSVSSTISASTTSQSLDGELMAALSQQHELDLSSAQSQIRRLENAVFEAEAKLHSYQKQVSTLEDELAQIRIGAKPVRPFSPAGSQQGGRGFKRPNDLRRASFASQRSNSFSTPPPPSAPTQPAIDHDLPAPIRHQRRVSLHMLKARMESEMEAATAQKRIHPPSRAMSPLALAKRDNTHTSLFTVHEPQGDNDAEGGHIHHARPQFLDESHVFWCASCKGDLIVL